MLEAQHITHQIGRKTLLDDVSLAVRPGELVAVVGANGAGKSTLLKTFSRELTPTQGQVVLDNKPINRFSALELARQRAVLAQQNPLAFEFTVYELVMMGRYPHFEGHPRPEDMAIVDFALVRTGITHLTGRAVPTLSGGEQQRVHLAKVLAQLMTLDEIQQPHALIQQPKYLLLDEPTTGLDLYYQHSLLDVASELTRRNYGVVAILHDLNLVMQYADNVLLLKEGRALAFGKPISVLTTEAIFSAFHLSVQIIHQPELDYPLIVHHRQTVPASSAPHL
ncbi:iron complex transport system ATP-binding protein [Larkinella arboricola]|uniref:Iron complex transport system ATP-binding protein n=1 Tax=Larkinella arboricola TaxID=643671 RepID=A0A327X8K4_LARAB|nr:heme ABC transporter ATP-binding protein [Larkinella arboricola]RAK03255.1 iron complex transport system ATP-binding protein [Larkinella arboricola]